MGNNLVITIARQYGSGGREIGERVSEILGYKHYDKELITMAANAGGLDADVLQTADEKPASSLLYTLAMGSNYFGSAMTFGYKPPLNDQLFVLQSNVIRHVAEEGPCVIIGRCADYVLRDHKPLLRVFILGDMQHRQARVVARHEGVSESDAVTLINKTDKRRASYYRFYTGERWGVADRYDLCINSSLTGIEGAANLIVDAARLLLAKSE